MLDEVVTHHRCLADCLEAGTIDKGRLLTWQSAQCRMCGAVYCLYHNNGHENPISIVAEMLEIALPYYNKLPPEFLVLQFKEQFPLVEMWHVREALWQVKRNSIRRKHGPGIYQRATQ